MHDPLGASLLDNFCGRILHESEEFGFIQVRMIVMKQPENVNDTWQPIRLTQNETNVALERREHGALPDGGMK